MRDRRPLEILIVVTVAVAMVGLITGVEGSGREVASYVDRRAPAAGAVEARSYRDMRTRAYGPNAALPARWWQALHAAARRDPFAPVAQTEADRVAVLARRAGRRAYDGAPPTVPHAVDQIGVPSCLSCHADGLAIAAKVAPVPSHARRDSCLQCHVVASDPRPNAITPATPETLFVGRAAPEAGERAWPGAPPTIPHATWMRERCESCHGLAGATGMRSTHPWRQSCTQCHAPSAVLDQRAPIALGGAP